MHASRIFFSILALALHVNAHGVLTTVTGTNGVTGQGFGVIDSTPRDGTRRNPFQQDTSIIRDKEIENGDAGVCGRTLAGGNNDVQTQLNAAIAAGLPSAAEDGTVTMTLHQVNGDGAGPYTCEVSTDATGANFAAMTVTTNVPGRNSRSNAKATDFALVAQMPAGATCTGGANGDACLVRCRNAAAAGPFGGCVAVTNTGSSSGNATATTDAASSEDTVSVDDSIGAATVSATDATATSASDISSTETGVAAAAGTGEIAGASSSTSTAGQVKGAGSVGQVGGAVANSVRTKAAKNLQRSTEENEEDEENGDISIHDAELALAADFEKRLVRVRRSRIVGKRSI
ncbi:putative gEgh 16 [Pyrrhoderma noxium]|uniref:GEgh 16 n=1 Tax=Pyrrhoderma noxium TaxID=2282107 RepID=A0A286UU08_9AGAM|nr:putative gEgh 16 [Pyrrhoderma noxium]